MAGVGSFEELEVWKRARILSKKIYVRSRSGTFSKDFKLQNQINSASGSIMDNIAEGFERDGGKEFIQFLSFAKGSSGEVRSQIIRAMDRDHISEVEFTNLYEETILISKQLAALIKYLNKGTYKGIKFIRNAD